MPAVQGAAWILLFAGALQVSFVKVPGGCTGVAGSGRWSQEGAIGRTPAVWSTLLRTQVGDTSAPF